MGCLLDFQFRNRARANPERPSAKVFHSHSRRKQSERQLTFSLLFCERLFRTESWSCTFSSMPRLPISVRIAATSILLLSLTHIVFWTTAAILARSFGLNASPQAILPVGMYFIAAAGFGGVVVAVGIFKARNWARIATLVLGALTAFICALALVILFALIAKPNGF